MSNTHLSLDEFFKLHLKIGPKDVILDVRRPEEFAEGHIKGALNIPVDQVANHTEELKKYSQVYIHCKRGGRAKTALETLSQLGLQNLVCIGDAGMDAWVERGYPIQKG